MKQKKLKKVQNIKDLISNMFETMYASSGVGLAGPQIGESIRIFIVDASPFSEPKDGEKASKEQVELRDFKKVFINPIVKDEKGKEWPFSEGCLSIPGHARRSYEEPKVSISYFDEDWTFHEETYEGIVVRIIQHEYDHIEGVLFTDHLNPFKRRLLKRKLDDIKRGLST